MSRKTAKKLVAVFPIALLFLGWLCSDWSPASRLESGEPKPQANNALKKYYYGNTKACGTSGCHSNTEEPGGKGKAKPTGDGVDTFENLSSVFSRRHELRQWEEQDKHRIATAVLIEGLGQRIAERMGLPKEITDPVTKTTHEKWKQCVTCHGVVIENDKEVDKLSFAPDVRKDSGVSCVACHGPHKEWVVFHQAAANQEEWQGTSREVKQTKYGLRDLWDPLQRAELCCSCHVGAVERDKSGKVKKVTCVTHEMYAAGHPPLPGFEIITFSNAAERHWETAGEKYHRLPKPEFKALFDQVYHFKDEPDLHQVRLLLTAAIVAFRNSVDIVAAYAEAEQQGGNVGAPKADDRAWPEFAIYDCYGCHHELTSNSWRQKRPVTGTPGRPQLREWPSAFLPLALKHEEFLGTHAGAEGAKPYRGSLDKLQAAFSMRPFGDAPEVATKAAVLVKWCNDALKRLDDSKLDSKESLVLLTELVNRPKGELLDFDSARHVGWGVRALLDQPNLSALKKAKDLDAPLASLGDKLKLDLLKWSGNDRPWLALKDVGDTHDRRTQYAPDVFLHDLKIIAETIRKTKLSE